MRVLITGHEGFVGRNLAIRLAERTGMQVAGFGRHDRPDELAARVREADAIVHLAGVNRPSDVREFSDVNLGVTVNLIEAMRQSGRTVPVIFASSVQARLDGPYGESKRAAEEALTAYADESGAAVSIFRLPNVFGKWCRPHYNSVVATFCHQIARGLPVRIDNAGHLLTLVHIDDVVDVWIETLTSERQPPASVQPEYTITVGDLEAKIRSFRDARQSLAIPRVGTGLDRALYSTYVSYLPPADFSYALPRHADERGVFVEFLKTPDSGQISFFVAKPGVTRGGHYHHAKTEKFLVVKGRAAFRFRHIVSNERYELTVSGPDSHVVETVPGWAHDITNTGQDDLVVLLWANEVFDRQRPDTVPSSLT